MSPKEIQHNKVYEDFKKALFNASEEIAEEHKEESFFKGYWEEAELSLEDVLRALENTYLEHINLYPGKIRISKHLEECNCEVFWLLGKSAFDQTDECLIALTNLLK